MTTKRKAMTDLIAEINRVHGRLSVAGDALLPGGRMTSARWRVLAKIAESSAPLPVASVAREMELSRQAVQRHVNALRRAGLVQFEPNPRHEVAQLVVLTPKGWKEYERTMDRMGGRAGDLVHGLRNEDIETATKTLRSLRQRLSAIQHR